MARWILLSTIDTGFVFATTHSAGRFTPNWIERAVAHEFQCDIGDLDFIEDDDMREFGTLHGEPIVEVHFCKLSGYVAAPIVIKIDEAA